MASVIISGVVGLALTVYEIQSFIAGLAGGVPANEQTSVTLVLGDAGNSGGSMPHIYAWTPNGEDLAEKWDDSRHKDQHLDGSSPHAFSMENKMEPAQDLTNGDLSCYIRKDCHTPGVQIAQPQYVTVAAEGSDAICISAVIASGNGATYTWTGDLGKQCGAQWVRDTMLPICGTQPLTC